MESTVSVSKGVFVFKNGLKSLKRTRSKRKSKSTNVNIYQDELWYQSYSSLWSSIEIEIDNLNKEMYSNILINLISFMKNCYTTTVTEIPTAALLMGINMPDHATQFTTFAKKIKQDVSPHVATLYSQDCQSLKYLVDNMINQFLNDDGISSDEEYETDIETKRSKIRKHQYNFSVLQAWYENEYGVALLEKSEKKTRVKIKRKVLVVIIPDFETFNERVLQDFILIASSYINILPFVLIFGLATSLTVLHKMLPYQVSSKVNIQVFNSQPSTIYLNSVLKNVFFTDECPFHLGGKVFNLYTDIFLFYDLSVTGFIQKYKYAMLEHFSFGNVMSLCTKRKKVNELIDNFNHNDCENARWLLSFRTMVEKESNENKIKLLTDDDYFKERLKEEVNKNFKYLNTFHLFLKCLHILVLDLPNQPLGKQIRELYSVAASKDITKTNAYKECFQLLNFQSKEELLNKVIKLSELIENHIKINKLNRTNLENDVENLCTLLEQTESATLQNDTAEELGNDMENMKIDDKMNRKRLKEKLLERTKQTKPVSKYELSRRKLLDFVSSLFEKYLYDPTTNYFYEIFFFNDVSIENHVVGAHRAAIHSALNDPQTYLQCDCCELPNDAAILLTMPDICIAYKLHLEYGKMINLYDWLQAFLSIVDPVCADDDDEKKEIDPRIQARFTQAVAELEFLGFVKSSKRKTDHVQRLTWGG